MEPEKREYKKILIQELEGRPQIQATKCGQKRLVDSFNDTFKWSQKPVMCYKDSGLGPERIVKGNGMFRVNHFFKAFLYAYEQHGDIVLIPDEIWIMISFYISKYIDKNAEKLRKQLVRHIGTKTLTVVEMYQSKEEAEAAEKNWDYFFDQIIQQIQKQTVEGVVQKFACNFSTTDKVYKTISTAIIMNSLQKFFKYHRMMAGCGINNVYMAGVREDWEKMIPKLQKLSQYDIDGQLKKYIAHMKVILENFLLTFDEKPDVEWWNLIMKSKEQKQIYGGEAQEIDGWILNFFGLYQKQSMQSFPEYTIKVPILLINKFTQKQKDLVLVSDFASVSKLNERAYKPDVAMAIFCKKVESLKPTKEQIQEKKAKTSVPTPKPYPIKTNVIGEKTEKKQPIKKQIPAKKEEKKIEVKKKVPVKPITASKVQHSVKPVPKNVMHIPKTEILPPGTATQEKKSAIHQKGLIPKKK